MTETNPNIFRKPNPTKGISGNLGSYILLGLALFALAFFGVCTPQATQEPLGGIAATVNGENITYHEFSRAYRQQTERMRSQYGENFDAGQQRVAQTVLEELIEDRIVYLKSKELGFLSSDEEIISFLRKQKVFLGKDGKFSEESFENYLSGEGFTESSFLEAMRRDLTTQKFRQFLASLAFTPKQAIELEYKLSEGKTNVEYVKLDIAQTEIPVAKEEVEKYLADKTHDNIVKGYFDSHRTEFSAPEQVHAQHVLISYKGATRASGDADKRTKEDARKRAEEVLAKMRAPGANFTELVKQYTDEPTGKTSGGDLGFFAHDNMVKDFSNAAFAQDVGAISDIVETQFGFHVIKTLEKKPKKEIGFEEAKPLIAKSLIMKDQIPMVLEKRAQEILDAAKQKNSDEVVARYKLEWKKTGEFASGSGFIPGIGSNSEISDAVSTLKTNGQVFEKAIRTGGAFYVIRLLEKKDADLSKFDDKTRKQRSMMNAYSTGTVLFSEFETKAKEEFESRKAIYRNPSYLAIDDRQNQGEEKQ